jgi:superfamily I DNA/RNA helicase
MFKLTKEQESILEKTEHMKQGEILLINALAGCAKTSTLKIISQNNLNSKFLYLAFNRKIVDEAKESFPSNTKATTLHALARAYSGRKPLQYMNMEIIKKILNIDIQSSKEYFKIFNALKAYQIFCQSAFSIDELDELKIDTRKKLEDEFKQRFENKNMDFIIEQRIKAIDYVEEIHYAILNSNFTTFDTFLKEFVETSNRRSFDYEYIVLDESQDVSKLLAKFIISLVKAKKYKLIIVGDNNQKIYGFLGNTNLSLVVERLYPELSMSMTLTKSFRFSADSKIERLSNQLLKLRGEEIFGARETVPIPSKDERVAYLSRGTFPLLAMSIHQILNKKEYHLYGGVANFNIKEIKDIYNLYVHTKKLKGLLDRDFKLLKAEEIIKILFKNRTKIPFPKLETDSLKAFSSFFELENFASSRAIFDLQDNINIVYFIFSKKRALEKIEDNSNGHMVDEFFSLIERHSNEKSKTVISTIHKSKGLEFESVIILKSLSMRMDIFSDKISTVSSETGHILGLNRVDIKSSIKNMPNLELITALNEAEKSDKNLFKKNTTSKVKYAEENIDTEELKVASELVINKRVRNIKEEYNILYVAITRAIRDIQISNNNYLETLDFLLFINKNLKEFIAISEGRESPVLVTIEKKTGRKKRVLERGVIYEDNFISISTLLTLLREI